MTTNNRNHWKKMLPLITAYVEGKTILHEGATLHCPGFNQEPEEYSIVVSSDKWLKTGWVKLKSNDISYQITAYSPGKIQNSGIRYYVSHKWESEEEMEEEYVPCPSPMGNKND